MIGNLAQQHLAIWLRDVGQALEEKLLALADLVFGPERENKEEDEAVEYRVREHVRRSSFWRGDPAFWAKSELEKREAAPRPSEEKEYPEPTVANHVW